MGEWDDNITAELERLFAEWDATTSTFKRDGAMRAFEWDATASEFDGAWFDRITAGKSEAQTEAKTTS